MDLSKERLIKARDFYERSPDGQHDEVAVVAINNLIFLMEELERMGHREISPILY